MEIEGGDYRQRYEDDTLVLEVERCPSMGRLIDELHLEPYEDYCHHWDTLYRRVLEPLGLDYQIHLGEACQTARCTIRVTNPDRFDAGQAPGFGVQHHHHPDEDSE